MSVRYESSTAKCKCRHCDQPLEFDSSQAGQTIQCPNCQMETMLFIPFVPRQAALHPALTKDKQARKNILAVAFVTVLCAIAITVWASSHPEMLTGDSPGETEVLQSLPLISILAVALVSGILYFVPAFLAARKANFNAIFALNFFLGWSLLGWAGALIWALIKEKPAVANLQN